jgi:hypothetical protein
MKILAILVCYGTGKTTSALSDLKGFHAALRDGNKRDYVVSDNALVADFCQQLDDDTTLIGGDNSLREFSGLNRALQFLGQRLAEYDLVHVVTETFNTDYRHYLGLMTPRILSLVVEKNISLGHIDAYPRDVSLFGIRSRTWIRSCYLLVATRAIQALGSFVTADGTDRFFSDDPKSPFHPQSPIDLQYQQYLLRWLTGGEGTAVEIGVHRTPMGLNAANFERFKAKALAIVNEHGLSIRLRRLGFPSVDVEWLYDMLLQAEAERIAWNTPIDEMLQYVALRRARLGITPP